VLKYALAKNGIFSGVPRSPSIIIIPQFLPLLQINYAFFIIKMRYWGKLRIFRFKIPYF